MDTPWQPLLDEARQLPHGPARLALLDEAVRLADAHGDTVAGFRIRDGLYIESAYEAGRPDKFLVAFTWCLAQCDREPTRYNAVEFCWRRFFFVLQAVRDSPDIPRAQAEAVLAELHRRLHEPAPMSWALAEQSALLLGRLGDLDGAAEWWARRDRLRRTLSPELLFNSQAFEARYHQMRGDEATALRVADVFFQWARQGRDSNSLAWVSAHLLLALLRAGREKEARHWQPLSYREMRNQVIRLGEIARHIEFFAAVGDIDQAVRLVERHAPWVLLSRETIDLYHFHCGAWLTAERLRSVGPTVKLRLPRELACYRPDGVYEPAGLANFFGAEMRSIAARYDARAGNDWFSRTMLDPVVALLDRPIAATPTKPPAAKLGESKWSKG